MRLGPLVAYPLANLWLYDGSVVARPAVRMSSEAAIPPRMWSLSYRSGVRLISMGDSLRAGGDGMLVHRQ